MARRVFPEDSPALNSENIKESFDKIERWLRYMQERIEHMNYSQGVIDLRQNEELGLVVERAGNTITINDDNIVTQSQRTSDNQTYTSSISQNAEKIALVVKTENNQNIIKAAEIVTAINATGSTVKISADHITLDGDVVMKSNLVDGTTQISGSNIVTGTITDAQGHFSLNMTTGSLTMNDGTIGGWVIDSNDIHKDATISSETYRAAVRAPSSPTASQAAFYVRKGASSPYTYPFVVYYDGKLKATDAEIEGTITSSNATITGGSINIDSSSLTYDIIKLSYYNAVTSIGPGRIQINNTTSNDYTTIEAPGVTVHGNNTRYADLGTSSTGGDLTLYDASGNRRAEIDIASLTFYDSSGTELASYPFDGLQISGLKNCFSASISSSGTKTYTLAAGSYLVTLTRTSGTSANYDGAWLVTAATNSRVTALKSPSNSGTSISMGTNQVLTVTTSQTNMRLTVTKLD